MAEPRSSWLRLLSIAISILAIWMCGVTAAQAALEQRVAVVIGNAAYSVAPLDNPLNDAQSVGSTLEELGFQVHLRENLDSTSFNTLVSELQGLFPPDSVGVLFYAGHGIQFRGKNYLVPTDASLTSPETLISQSVEVGRLLSALQSANVGLSILILDACRDNPFKALDKEFGTGLNLIEDIKGEALVAYATAAGATALDGIGPNSPYSSALISSLELPDREVYDVFRRVRARVREATGGQQLPWVSGSVERSFIFNQDVEEAATAAEPSEFSVDSVFWDIIRTSLDPVDFELFLRNFPGSLYASLAAERLRGLEAERSLSPAQGSQSPDQGAASAPEQRKDVPELRLTQATTGDRVPPEPLRLWPTVLSTALPEGLANTVTPCDILAADPDDPARLAPGVSAGLLNTRDAIRQCAVAIAREPNNPRALYQFGRALDGAEKYREALFFYELAAQHNYSAAIVSMGFLHLNGRGVEKDSTKAAEYYRRAALLGNLRARTNLGELYEKGDGVTKAPEEAVLWYRLAAAGGWPNAIDRLGNLYRDGTYLEKDFAQAAWLYEIAAELGNTNAANNLGRLYEEGKGVDADPARALELYDRSSQAGNRFAAFNLGRVYREGKLARRNLARSIEYYRLAADRGFTPAFIELAATYLRRASGPSDLSDAAYYLFLADLAGEAKAKQELQKVSAQLSAEALEAARAQAEQWWRQNGR